MTEDAPYVTYHNDLSKIIASSYLNMFIYSYDLPNQEDNNIISFVSPDLLNTVNEFTRIINEWEDEIETLVLKRWLLHY